MTKEYISGMEARAENKQRINGFVGKDRDQWFTGYDAMDRQIIESLHNVKLMLDGIALVRSKRLRVAV